MKVADLYELYKEKVASSTENLKKEIYSLFDENIKLQDVATDKILYILRNLLVSCSDDAGDIRRLNYSYWEIGTYVAMVAMMTDVEFQEKELEGDDSDGESLSTIYSYDMLKKMRLEEYIAKRHVEAYNRFMLIKTSEEKTFEKENDTNAVFEKSLSYVAGRFGELLDRIGSAIDNFDPSQIESARKLLNDMNEGVQKISNITDFKK